MRTLDRSKPFGKVIGKVGNGARTTQDGFEFDSEDKVILSKAALEQEAETERQEEETARLLAEQEAENERNAEIAKNISSAQDDLAKDRKALEDDKANTVSEMSALKAEVEALKKAAKLEAETPKEAEKPAQIAPPKKAAAKAKVAE